MSKKLADHQTIYAVESVIYQVLGEGEQPDGGRVVSMPTFNNSTMPQIPQTGDQTPLAGLWLLLISGSLLALWLKQRLRA